MKISIITASYNSASTIVDTIKSVITQSYTNIEYIIIDGGSTDGTVDIIQVFSPWISHWVSEPDGGIYEAMNKGIQLATGDIIGILNSDDFYVHSEVISQVVSHFKRTKADSIYGNIQYVSQFNTQKIVRHWVSGEYQRQNFLLGWMPPHPAFFVKREVYHSLGYFNTRLKTSADYEFMLRTLFKHKVSSHYLPELIVRMRTGGASNRSIQKRLFANWEDRLAWKINGLRPYFFTAVLKPIRKIKQFFTIQTTTSTDSKPTPKRKKDYVA
jgi:glycosyltransferase involved in cell wall biosynthesis